MKFRAVRHCIFRISFFLVLIGTLAFLLFDVLRNAFLYNVYINSIIFLVFLSGIISIYRRLFLYSREYKYLLNFDSLSKEAIDRLKLLSPIGMYVTYGSNYVTLSKVNSILGSIEKRIEDKGDFPKYLSGILIFLGLLGTFWGLSQTIGNVANIIDTLGIDQSGATESFSKLKDSLRIPLSGMGVAFGCSLFGLSGSLILGFLNINQRKTADKFLYEIEEWLTLKTVNLDVPQDYHGPVFSMGLMEKTIEMIYAFQNQLREFEMNRVSLLSVQKDFSRKLSQLIETSTQNQELILQAIHSLTQSSPKQSMDIIEKLDGIEKSMNDFIQNSISNRDYLVENLGKEIRMVSKTLSSLAGTE